MRPEEPRLITMCSRPGNHGYPVRLYGFRTLRSVRVAIVAECFLPAVNGVTGSVCRVVDHLERLGHEVLVIAPGDGPDRYQHTPVARVRGVSLPLYRSLEVGLVDERTVAQLLADFAPDVVHLAAPVVLGAVAGRAARELGIPVVAIYQTDLAGFARRYHARAAVPFLWSRLRAAHEAADLTLAPSTAAAWQLAGNGIERVALWPRGVDADRFHPRRRGRLPVSGRGVVAGYVGRLATEKRVHLLRHAVQAPGVQVVAVGDGPRARALRRQLPEVRFLGFQSGDELAATVASLDVFVHTGRDETFCQAVQEALAAGVPVVGPAAGGILDLVRHGENGFLYPPDDPVQITGAVASIAGDPALRARLGEQARRSVEGRTWETVGDALLGHYRSVLAESTRRAA